jgi:hypothetical protein
MIDFEILSLRATLEHLGFIPHFFSESDPRSARDQAHENYAHGGGWHKFKGFTLDADQRLCFPGDPALQPLARATLHEETILIYPRAWVAIVQPNGDFEVSRMD